MTKSHCLPRVLQPKKQRPLRFVRVAEPSKPGERPLVVLDKEADRARSLAQATMDRKRNISYVYPLNRQHEANLIMSAQRNRR